MKNMSESLALTLTVVMWGILSWRCFRSIWTDRTSVSSCFEQFRYKLCWGDSLNCLYHISLTIFNKITGLCKMVIPGLSCPWIRQSKWMIMMNTKPYWNVCLNSFFFQPAEFARSLTWDTFLNILKKHIHKRRNFCVWEQWVYPDNISQATAATLTKQKKKRLWNG